MNLLKCDIPLESFHYEVFLMEEKKAFLSNTPAKIAQKQFFAPYSAAKRIEQLVKDAGCVVWILKNTQQCTTYIPRELQIKLELWVVSPKRIILNAMILTSNQMFHAPLWISKTDWSYEDREQNFHRATVALERTNLQEKWKEWETQNASKL